MDDSGSCEEVTAFTWFATRLKRVNTKNMVSSIVCSYFNDLFLQTSPYATAEPHSSQSGSQIQLPCVWNVQKRTDNCLICVKGPKSLFVRDESGLRKWSDLASESARPASSTFFSKTKTLHSFRFPVLWPAAQTWSENSSAASWMAWTSALVLSDTDALASNIKPLFILQLFFQVNDRSR